MNPATPVRTLDLERAYALLRLSLGLNICLHGTVRWAAGLSAFAASMVTMFAKTPLPPWSVRSFGIALPILETVIGAAVLLGFQTRRALILGMLVMLALSFGTILRQDWQAAGLQLAYSFVYAVLLAGAGWNRYCIDRTTEPAP